MTQTGNMHSEGPPSRTLDTADLERDASVLPCEGAQPPRQPGRLRGQICMATDFDTIDDETAALFDQGP